MFAKRMSKYSPYNSAARHDPNCRACTDFKTWSKQQREITRTVSTKNSIECQPRKEFHHIGSQNCPLNKDSLGNGTWGLLHTIAAVYPEQPSERDQRDVRVFMDTLSRLYPCTFCAKGIQKDLRSHPVQASSQEELSQWMCRFHNRVNESLGKPLFDCSTVNQRWRDGWKDGSCD